MSPKKTGQKESKCPILRTSDKKTRTELGDRKLRYLSPTDMHKGKFCWTRADGYQTVASCFELRIFASLVTNAIPSASAVAPIKRSHGSLE